MLKIMTNCIWKSFSQNYGINSGIHYSIYTQFILNFKIFYLEFEQKLI